MKYRRIINNDRNVITKCEFAWEEKCGCRFHIFYNMNDNNIKDMVRKVKFGNVDAHNIFGCSLGSELTEKQREKKSKLYWMKKHLEYVYWALQDRGLGIPQRLFESWNIKYPDVWNSETKCGKEKVFKFSYHVKSGELLIAPLGIHHNIMILSDGKFRFEEYVRGIFFREKRIIYLRMHENLEWLKRTEEIFRINGLPKSVRIMFGEKAANRLKGDLEGL